MIAELDALDSLEQATRWARRILPAKNTLTLVDAEQVEAAFGTKIGGIREEPVDKTPQSADRPEVLAHNDDAATKLLPVAETLVVPSSIAPVRRYRAAEKTIRLRDKEHRKFVAQQPCLVCGRAPCDAHHLRFAQARAMARKVSDEFTVPLCRIHHGEVHRVGNESGWWTQIRIDPLPVARALWDRTRRFGGCDDTKAVDGLTVPTSAPGRARRNTTGKTNPVLAEYK